MDRRWATAGAAVAAATAVAVLAAVVTSTLGPDEPAATGRVALAAPSAGASPEDAPTPEPAEEPTAAPAPTRSPAAEEPDAQPSSPLSSEPDAPTSAPRSPQPDPRPTSPRPRPPAPAPAPASPPPPSPAAPARAAFAFDAAYGTDEPREVVVQYGDSSSCPHARVTHTVRESADRVVVTLEADAMDPGRACTADYRQRLVPVALQSPLGDRVLVDGSRGEQVPVDRSCQRPFEEPPPPKDCEP